MFLRVKLAEALLLKILTLLRCRIFHLLGGLIRVSFCLSSYKYTEAASEQVFMPGAFTCLHSGMVLHSSHMN